MARIWHLILLMSTFLFLISQAGAEDHLPGDDVVLKTREGSVSLAGLQGKVVYVDFWASWCGPCRKSFPWMNVMQRKYADQGLVILAVNLDSDKQMADMFLKNYPVAFCVAYDPEGKLANRVRIKTMPSSFLLNRKGVVMRRHSGFQSDETTMYESEIEQTLVEDQISERDQH